MIPIVAIVGRPNVGKSTLFNRLAGRKLAIVHDAPGVTRDRHYVDTHVHGRDITLIDTGGFDPTTDDPMGQGIARQVQVAIAEADVVVCVLDGTAPPTHADSEAIELLRRSEKPVVYAANKADSEGKAHESNDLYRLGIEPLIAVSALHGRGTASLEEAIVRALPPVESQLESDLDGIPRVALLGRPNAGKSSLFNRLAGSERSLVDSRPGTTRDPIDTRVSVDGRDYILVDTAGIRRKAKVSEDVELASVMRALRIMERVDVVVLMCDADTGLAEQDQRLLGLCRQRGRGVVVGLNKLDLLKDRDARKKAEEHTEDELHFARWAPTQFLSAKTGRGVVALMRRVGVVYDDFHKRIPTGQLNRFFANVLEKKPPPTSGGKAPRLYYITQATTAPPGFVIIASSADHVRESYRRFVSNQLRKEFGFEGVPFRLYFRDRKRKKKG